MEISEIKAKLTLETVLTHYGLQPDSNKRLHCPFHEDKTPSMQVYYDTNTVYCFSSKCKTHGHSLDVIGIIEMQEKSSKAEAITKATEMLTGPFDTLAKQELKDQKDQKPEKEPFDTISTKSHFDKLSATLRDQKEQSFLTQMFNSFKASVNLSQPAKDYLQSRNLDHKLIEVGFNSGQFHHGTKRDEKLIKNCLEYGLLIDKGVLGRTGEKAYQVFGKGCIVFALKNAAEEITGLYCRSTTNNENAKHFYLKDRKGLYPGYPNPETKKLILTEAIIDAATLLQNESTQEYTLLACYGTNGLTSEHLESIQKLKHLEEIIFFFDGDEAGRIAVEKYAKVLQEIQPDCKITNVQTPENEDVNSLSKTEDLIEHLLETRKEISPSQSENTVKNSPLPFGEGSGVRVLVLNTENPNNWTYNGKNANFIIKGGLRPQTDSLKLTLQMVHPQTKQAFTCKIDLYDYKQLHAALETASQVLEVRKDLLDKDIQVLTNVLENHRDNETQNTQNHSNTQNRMKKKVPEHQVKKCLEFLKSPNLLKNLNEKIGNAGVVGEENSRLLLFIIGSSYNMKETLHAIVQGTSGSGKTTQIKVVARLMPDEDVKRFTRVTEGSFYNYGEFELENVLVVIEDADGLEDKALFAFRELQSNGAISSSTTQKQDNGEMQSKEKWVRGPIASFSATTKGEYYEDNLGRCFVIVIDESKNQTDKVVSYQNQKAAGKIDLSLENQSIEFIQNCIRMLKPYEVINPFAEKILLPEDVHQKRRLNQNFQSIVKQITILNQYQREKDEKGRLITDKQDIIDAIEILFESILLKQDELDGTLRQFYESLKTLTTNKNNRQYEFTRFEAMEITGLKKSQLQVNLTRLVELEYLNQMGAQNKGYKYKIAHWDSMQMMRTKLKDFLTNQLEKL